MDDEKAQKKDGIRFNMLDIMKQPQFLCFLICMPTSLRTNDKIVSL